MRFSVSRPNDPWYDGDDAPRLPGSGILVTPEAFGYSPGDAAPGDVFARRQDAIVHLNGALAEADAAAAKALEERRARFFADGGATDFAAGQRELLNGLRKTALRNARREGRAELGQAFDALAERHLRRAVSAEHEARVRARALGAERALGAYRDAALADPDGLPDRVADADALLARMVEAGTDPHAAAERAGRFRHEIGSAVLDDLAERDPGAGLARLDAGTFDAVFDDAGKSAARERLARLAEANAQAISDRAAFAERSAALERAAGRRATIRELTAGLRVGAMDQSHVARALDRGDLDESDADRLRTQLTQFNDQRVRRAEMLDRLDAAVRGETGIVEGDQWEPDVIDEWVRRERQRGAPLAQIILETFGVTSRIPNIARDELRTSILSSSPEGSVLAGRTLRSLRQSSPEAADAVIAELPIEEAGILTSLAKYAHLDLPPARLRELAEEDEKEPDREPEKEPQEEAQRLDPGQHKVIDITVIDSNGKERRRTDLIGMTLNEAKAILRTESWNKATINVEVPYLPMGVEREREEPIPGKNLDNDPDDDGDDLETVYSTPRS